MTIIDEKGRLFGKVNIIDAAVVVLIGIFILAAATFLVDTSEPVTVHAQVQASDVPRGAAERLEPGMTLGDHRVTVTDVVAVPVTDSVSQVFVKVRILAESSDGIRRLGQTTLSPGASIPITIGGQTVPGKILLLDNSEDLVYFQEPTRLLFVGHEAPLPLENPPQAGALTQLGSHNILRVGGTLTAPTGPSRGDVYVWGDSFRVSGPIDGSQARPLSPGSKTTLSFPGQSLSGEILHTPGDEGPAAVSELLRVSVVATTTDGTVPPPAGTEQRMAGEVFAEIVDLILLRGPVAGANMEDAPSRSWRIDIQIEVVRLGDLLLYQGEPVRTGEELSFSGPAGTVSGAIQQIGDASPPAQTRNVRLLVERVPPWVTAQLHPGDVETSAAGQPLLEIKNLTETPASVVLETHDGRLVLREHPTLWDITMVADLSTSQEGRFKLEPVNPGATLFIAPDGIPLRATVLEVIS